MRILLNYVTNYFSKLLLTIAVFLTSIAHVPNSVAEVDFTAEHIDAKAVVKMAVEYWRDESSYTVASMKIHRPKWERTSRLRSWTVGQDRALVRFVSPAKDAGNATLSSGDNIWIFTPKTGRIIKIPPSMKSQSWMGSDFSYQDLAKDDDIIDKYEHKIIAREKDHGKVVLVIESTPHDDAPIVWGKEILKVRADSIILEHQFFDQDMVLVKELRVDKIAILGGKIYPVVIRMLKVEEEDEWTEIVHEEAKFGESYGESFFTLSNLQNPRR